LTAVEGKAGEDKPIQSHIFMLQKESEKGGSNGGKAKMGRETVGPSLTSGGCQSPGKGLGNWVVIEKEGIEASGQGVDGSKTWKGRNKMLPFIKGIIRVPRWAEGEGKR